METKVGITLAVILVCMAFLIPQSCQAANLLANPGFEEGYRLMLGEYGDAWDVNNVHDPNVSGWIAAFPGSFSYSVEETHYQRNSEPYSFHSGANAMSHSTEGNGESISKQVVWVVPGETYTASVWVKGWDHTSDATGFGADGTTDSAGMTIRELDYLGNLILEHTELVITDPVDWTQLSEGPFQVGPNTYKIEYVLRSLIHCHYTGGRTAFDDCVLDGPAGSPPEATVTGVVSAGGSPVADATVTIGSQTDVTGSDGVYSIAGIMPESQGNQVNVQCTGYLTENKYPILAAGTNTVNFDLSAPPTNNLLANGDFEQGGPYATGDNMDIGTDKGWTFQLDGFNTSYLRRESSLNKDAPEPDGVTWPWQPHSGTEASRNCTSGQGFHLVYQDIPVVPGSLYKASVWIKARNFDEQGFGVEGSGDYAGLHIQEFDGPNLVLDHPIVSITGATDWVKLTDEFTTQANTSKVAFMLETAIGGLWADIGHWQHGQIIYDDAVLDGESPVGDISGLVYKEGVPLAGATVTAGGQTATTDANGEYTISGIIVPAEKIQVTASATGCYPENKFISMIGGPLNTADFDLYAVAGNQLLVNGDNEDPDAPYVLRATSGEPQVDAGWTCRIWSPEGAGLRRESTIYQGVAFKDWEFGGQGVGPGPWEPFSGTQCSRHCVEGTSGQFEVSQTVWVQPNATYRAWAMGKLVNAFGDNYMGIEVEEYDINDNLVNEYMDTRDSTATNWTRIYLEFTTNPSTAKVKFMLNSYLSVNFTAGWANFDLAVLDGPAGTPPSSVLTGTVAIDGSPVAGATVTIGTASGTTNASGGYTINVGALVGQSATATVHYPGCFEEQKVLAVQAGQNVLDFALVALPTNNLLANPGFEDGYDLTLGLNGGVCWDVYNQPVTITHGWIPMMLGTTLSYSVEETHYKRNSPPYSFHSGANAMSHSSDGWDDSAEVMSSQTVGVRPGGSYTAMVWAKGWDFTGAATAGFGAEGTNDTAGMQIRELDSAGNLVENGEHTELVITDPVDWTLLKETFVAGPNTAQIQYILRSRIHCKYTGGRTAFDDAVLDGPSPLPPYETVATIPELKAKPDETSVRISGKVVSASFDGFFYIEEETRASGIKVTGTAAAGTIADIIGVIRTVDGERTLVSVSVETAVGGTVPKPLGMTNKTSGRAPGPATVGLYATIWGRVDATGGSPFTLTDGSGANLKVYAPAGYSAAANDYVMVIGAIGAEMSGSEVVPVIRAVSVRKVN